MRYLHCLITVIIMASAWLWCPVPAIAEPATIRQSPHSIDITQISTGDVFWSGVDKMQRGNYQGAIADFTQEIQHHPNHAKAYSNRGVVLFALGDWQGALSDFNQALRLNPVLATVYYNRGFIRFQLREYQAAVADLSQAIQLNPADADAYQCRCFVHHQLGDQAEMVADFHKAAELYLQQGELEQYLALLKSLNQLQAPSMVSLSSSSLLAQV